MTDLAFLIPALLAWLYSVIGGIEFGLPAIWLAGAAADRTRLEHYLSPVWETTNVLAVMALTGFVVLFPVELPVISTGLRGPLLLGGGLLLVRALLVLIVFYLKRTTDGWMRTLALVSLLLPAVLFQLPLRLIDGDNPGLMAGLIWALLGGVSCVALAAGLFAWREKKDSQLAPLARWLTLLTIVLAWAALIVVLPNRSDYLIGSPSNWRWLVVVAPLVAAFMATLINRARLLLPTLIAALAGLWLFLFIHQPPYLFYPNILLSGAITNSQTVAVALFSTAFFMVVLLPFAVWLYHGALKD